jgi:hypothetical protein
MSRRRLVSRAGRRTEPPRLLKRPVHPALPGAAVGSIALLDRGRTYVRPLPLFPLPSIVPSPNLLNHYYPSSPNPAPFPRVPTHLPDRGAAHRRGPPASVQCAAPTAQPRPRSTPSPSQPRSSPLRRVGAPRPQRSPGRLRPSYETPRAAPRSIGAQRVASLAARRSPAPDSDLALLSPRVRLSV